MYNKLFDFHIDADENCEGQLAFLHSCIDPAETVKQYWRSTSKSRIKELVCNQGLQSYDYYSQYPALLHIQMGLDLVYKNHHLIHNILFLFSITIMIYN